MVLIPPQARPSGGTMLGNHEARIRALERFLGGGWRFNFDNEGGWGYVQFNDSFDLDLLPDPLAVGGTVGAALEEASGEGFVVGSTTTMRVKGSPVVIESETSPLTIFVNGKQFEFHDDGTIHIPIGGSVIADL